MGRMGTGPRWRAGLLALAMLVAGDGQGLLSGYAGALAAQRAAATRAPGVAPFVAPVLTPNRVAAFPVLPLLDPIPSLAPPTVPLNPALDGEATKIGTPPDDFDFAQAGVPVAGPPGNSSGNLTSASGSPQAFTTAPFVVAADAQVVTVFVKSLSATTTGQFYFDVLVGTTVTTINGTDILVPPAGEIKRYTTAPWQGQTIQLRMRRAYGGFSITDLGAPWVELPSWGMVGRARRVHGGPGRTGFAARLDTIEGSAAVTTAPFALDPTAQRLALGVRADAAGARVGLDLLSGPGFATVTIERGRGTFGFRPGTQVVEGSILGRSR